MASYQIMRPLGNSAVQSPHDDDDLAGLREVLGDFWQCFFGVMRTSDDAVQIRLKRTKVPTAQGGAMDFEEVVGGLVGDSLRLTFGRFLTINDVTSQGVMMTFESFKK